jgi:hypothetical protein
LPQESRNVSAIAFPVPRNTQFKPDSWRTIMSNTESAVSRPGPSLDLYAVALALLAALLVRFNLIPPIKW